jgi:hypothetical protein
LLRSLTCPHGKTTASFHIANDVHELNAEINISFLVSWTGCVEENTFKYNETIFFTTSGVDLEWDVFGILKPLVSWSAILLLKIKR